MHNVTTSNNAFAAQTCIVLVVARNKSNIALYFLKAENLNSSNADMCSDVAGLRVAAQAISLTLDLSLDPLLLLFPPPLALLATILDLSKTTTPILPVKACFVIMHKVYSLAVLWYSWN